MLAKAVPKEAGKPRSRSSQRRNLKSPIRIKDKIKELEDKLARPVLFRRQKLQDRQPLSPAKELPPKQELAVPFKKLARHYEARSSERPQTSSLFSSARHPLPSKRASEQEDRQLFPARALKLDRIQSHRELAGGREQQSLQRLKAENQKYKQIYSKSQQKMHELEYVLHEIKGQHESEKYLLQRTIHALQKKIDEKKINLGHLYAYDEKGNNFLLVQDRIIAETDNENSSSSPDAASKRNSNLPKPSPELSNLSLESK